MSCFVEGFSDTQVTGVLLGETSFTRPDRDDGRGTGNPRGSPRGEMSEDTERPRPTQRRGNTGRLVKSKSR